MPSILSTSLAKELMTLLIKSYDKPVSVTTTPGGLLKLTITARNCSNQEGLTGGVIVETRTPANALKPTGRLIVKRLRPDWTRESFTRLVHRVLTSACLIHAEDEVRSTTYKKIDEYIKSQKTPGQIASSLAVWAIEHNMPIDYEVMTVEQCESLTAHVQEIAKR